MTMPFSSLWQLLTWRAAQAPDAPFLTNAQTHTTISLQDFVQQAEQLAQVLHTQGIGCGSVVAWQMPTAIETAVTMFALCRLGAVQAPIIHLYREREITEILQQAQAQYLLVMDDEGSTSLIQRATSAVSAMAFKPLLLNYRELVAKHAAVAVSLPEYKAANDDVRWYFFTSGTTGRPKGAKHTDQSLMAGGFFLGSAIEVSGDDIGSIAYPVAHIGGMVYLSMALKAGMPIILLPHYNPDFVVATFTYYKVTLAGGSTAHYQVLLAQQRRQPNTPLFPSLRLLSGGGAAKPAALYWQVKDELGLKIIHAYGMTEAPITSSNTPNDTDEQLTSSDGEVLPELELKIVHPDGSRVNPGDEGEIILRGPNLCKGYLLPEQTEAAFDADGFYHTGDLGRMRDDGHIAITGRLKDIIIRKGENISAREIEELLAKHPDVKDAAVIGLPDEERGELVCAVIEQVEGSAPLSMAAMQQFLAEHQLMRQKIPERLEILPKLPRNESLQKVKKNELVSLFSST